jgi:DNA modification methylase
MIHVGDATTVLRTLDAGTVQTCVTSPPYFGLRDYGTPGQIGLEPTLDAYVARLVEVFREVRRVLRADGTLWLNLGDTYSAGKCGRGDVGNIVAGHQTRTNGSGVKPVQRPGVAKQLLGVPWRVAFALQADGWILRQDIIWAKPNPMPESVKDRCTKSHEYVFLLSKSARYHFDAAAIEEPSANVSRAGKIERTFHSANRKGAGRNDVGREVLRTATRNKRDVWTVATKPFKEAHFACFPLKLIEPCILAGCPAGGVVLDPFAGAGTTWLVAKQHGRQFVGIELNPEYAEMARKRVESVQAVFV